MKPNNPSRRQFLKLTAATSAAIAAPYFIPASARGADGRPAPSSRIVMGAIGIGNQGSGDLSGFLGFPQVQMVAIGDCKVQNRDRGKAAVDRRYGNADCKTYADFRDLLARPDIDAILMAVPDHWHATMAVLAMRAGKDVYCEKPLSLTIDDGKKMVEAASTYARVFSCGSQRVLGDYTPLHKAVRGGYIGEVKEAWVNVGGPSGPCNLPEEPVPDGFDYNMWLGPAPWAPYNPQRVSGNYGGPAWRTWSDYSGGGMTDWGGHKFAAALFAMGLEYTGPVEVHPPDGKDFPLLTYIFANGIRMYHGGGGDIRFRGTEGEVPAPGRRGIPQIACEIPGYHGSGGIFGDFLYCVKTREKTFQNVEVAHRAATVCHLGNICYWLNRPLKWDPEKQDFVNDPEASRWLRRAKREPWVI